MNWKTDKRFKQAAGLIILALVSFFVIAELGVFDKFNAYLIGYLNEKQAMVTGLAMATATTSTGLTLIPGDTAMPLAQNIADLGNYLIVVFGAIWLQKYLVGMTGFVAFKILYPLAALLFAGNIFWQKEAVKQVAMKSFLLGTVVMALIPMSVGISKHIEQTHQISVQEKIKDVEENNEALEQDKSLIDRFSDSVSGFFKEAGQKVEQNFSNLLDAVAVLIITTCIIPIVVFLFFIWLINLIFGLQLSTSLPKISLLKARKLRLKQSQKV